MTTVSSLLGLDKQELNRGESHCTPSAVIEIMKSQPYAILTRGQRRANQNINPGFCKANHFPCQAMRSGPVTLTQLAQ